MQWCQSQALAERPGQQRQQHHHGQERHLHRRATPATAPRQPPARRAWTDAVSQQELSERESFYGADVLEWAQQPVEPLTLRQMLELGREAWQVGCLLARDILTPHPQPHHKVACFAVAQV